MTDSVQTVSLGEPQLVDVKAARERIKDSVLHTPLLPLDLPNSAFPVYVKPENLQAIGSFKIRGATNFLASLPADVRAKGVVAHSSGNHAQGVAAAAKRFGVKATIVIPEGAPAIKVANTKALGATVVRSENTQAGREAAVREIAEREGATPVPPFDHPWIVAGQGTVGLEIAADLPAVRNVLVPIGGGGLAAGVALAIKSLIPDAQVIGVEPELAADAKESLSAGVVRTWDAAKVARTIADGVRSQSIGQLNFTMLSRYLAGVVTVTEAEIADAVRFYASKSRLVVEPTGAISLAALRRLLSEGAVDGISLLAGPTVVVASGGNVDPTMLCDLLAAKVE